LNQTETNTGINKKPILVAILIAVAVGMIGGLATEIGPWYLELTKPAWQPPDWLFGPMWTMIYIFTGMAGVRAWRRGNGRQRGLFMSALTINCVLNVLWSILFFYMKRPDIALIEVALLWLSVLAMAVLTWPYAKRSSFLLLPYLIWVAIAAYLNWTIVKLNGPF
jgi:tryptophan-rich sensory protein